ncbi:MAG: membrane protein insertion efficiency factor YidD [FCB group bacterium]|nr:membrane protein insertion efficiency factor YidD [FCB group bacterium]
MILLSALAYAQQDATVLRAHYFDADNYRQKFNNPKMTTRLEKDGKSSFTAKIFMEAIYMYKDIISPQDLNVCSFHPSCSEYAFLCLKHQSFPEAVLNAGDRLLRCYEANAVYYTRDSLYQLSLDYPDTTR